MGRFRQYRPATLVATGKPLSRGMGAVGRFKIRRTADASCRILVLGISCQYSYPGQVIVGNVGGMYEWKTKEENENACARNEGMEGEIIGGR